MNEQVAREAGRAMVEEIKRGMRREMAASIRARVKDVSTGRAEVVRAGKDYRGYKPKDLDSYCDGLSFMAEVVDEIVKQWEV